MIRIRRKKKCAEERCEDHEPCGDKPPIESDAFYAGAYPGKPWERLTNIRHGRGSTIKILNDREQAEAVRIARAYFGFQGNDFPRARLAIQEALDDPRSERAMTFFERAIVTEKRLAIRAYLSDADGRFVAHEAALPLLRHVADAGLDFEVGAIDHYLDGERKTEFVVGDGTEVISDKGYWFAHTHPAKPGVTNNVLPSTADLDVILSTARSLTNNLRATELVNYVMRDIGASRVTVATSIGPPPSQAKIERILVEYYFSGGDDPSIAAHAAKLASHLRIRHRLTADQVKLVRRNSDEEVLQ